MIYSAVTAFMDGKLDNLSDVQVARQLAYRWAKLPPDDLAIVLEPIVRRMRLASEYLSAADALSVLEESTPQGEKP